MELRATITVAEYGFNPEDGERFLAGFLATHPEVGPVVEQNSQTGELSVTFSYDSPTEGELTEAVEAATDRASKIFAEGAAASGLEPSAFVGASFEVVRDSDEVDRPTPERELQPA